MNVYFFSLVVVQNYEYLDILFCLIFFFVFLLQNITTQSVVVYWNKSVTFAQWICNNKKNVCLCETWKKNLSKSYQQFHFRYNFCKNFCKSKSFHMNTRTHNRKEACSIKKMFLLNCFNFISNFIKISRFFVTSQRIATFKMSIINQSTAVYFVWLSFSFPMSFGNPIYALISYFIFYLV